MNPVTLPPGRAKLATTPAPTGPRYCENTIGTLPLARWTASSSGSENNLRRESNQFRGALLKTFGVAQGPTMINPQIPADEPTSLLQPFLERCHIGLRFRIVRRQIHQNTNATHAILRPRPKRPRGCRAAEQRNEFAAFHCPMPPVLQTERIAHLSYGRRLLRCGILFQAMSAWGSCMDGARGARGI